MSLLGKHMVVVGGSRRKVRYRPRHPLTSCTELARVCRELGMRCQDDVADCVGRCERGH
jgi:hypothetical protein